MKQGWFKKTGWIYIPINALGVLVTLMAIIFLIPVYMAIVRNGHSVSDDLYQCLFIQHVQHSGGNGSLKKQVNIFIKKSVLSY